MKIRNDKVYKRVRRHRRVRNKISGSAERPRLCVFKSARHIYAQLIDDDSGRTIVSASSLKIGPVKATDKAGVKIVQALEVGKRVAELGKEKGIAVVCFDRGGYKYHGRVAALANAARESGLKF